MPLLSHMAEAVPKVGKKPPLSHVVGIASVAVQQRLFDAREGFFQRVHVHI